MGGLAKLAKMRVLGLFAPISGVKDGVVVLGYLLFCLFALFNGLLMLISPKRQIEFWDKVVRANRWSRSNSDWKPGREVESRLAGLGIVVMALWMASLPVRWLLHPKPLGSAPASSSPMSHLGSYWSWSILVIAVPIFAWGVYMLIKPERVAKWVEARNPQRIFPEQIGHAGLWAIRLIGIGIIVVSAFGIFVSVARAG